MKSGWWPPLKLDQRLLFFHLPESTQLLTNFKLVPFLPPPLSIFHCTHLLIFFFFELPIILISLAKIQFSQHFQQAVLEQLLAAAKKPKKSPSILPTISKMNLKWIAGLNVKPRTRNF